MTRPASSLRRFSNVPLALLACLAFVFGSTPASAQLLDKMERERAEKYPQMSTRKPYKREAWSFQQRAYPTGVIPEKALQKAEIQIEAANALRQEQKAKGAALDAVGAVPQAFSGGVLTNWVNIGPGPILGGQTTPPQNVSGRISCLAIDPEDQNRWLVGAAQGGVWVTEDAGATWSAKTDGMVSLSMGALAFAPGSPDVVYAGTGESVTSDSYGGQGLLKSTDGGNTWVKVSDTGNALQGVSFSEIRVSSTNANVLMATTTFGVYGRGTIVPPSSGLRGILKSTDGGQTWSRKVPGASSEDGSDVEVDASNFNNQYAAVSAGGGTASGGVYRSTDGGDTWGFINGPWTNSTNFPGGIGRIEMAMSPADSNVVYVSIQDRTDPSTASAAALANDGNLLGIWKTINALSATPTWTQLSFPNAANTLNLWYNQQLLVDPSDSRVLFFGGVNFLRYDGRPGASPVWKSLQFNLHTDQHAMAFSGADRLVIGNDGGVWSRNDHGDNSTAWAVHNTNLMTIQFYEGAIHPTDKSFALGGAQDNGTSNFTGFLEWSWVGSGDGADAVVASSSAYAVSSQNLTIQRTINGGATFTDADEGITDNGDDGNADRSPFIARILRSPNNANIVLAGTDNVWRSNNFFQGAAPTWSRNGPDMSSGGFVRRISAMAFAKSDVNSNTYAYGTDSGQLRLTTDGGANWAVIDAADAVPQRYVTNLVFDPTDANILYVTLSGFDGNTPGTPGHVFRTRNALAASPTWQNISPPVDLPHNAVALDTDFPQVIYVGTDLGLWEGVTSPTDPTVWTHVGPEQGMPNVAVFDLEFQGAGSRRLFAFTHGRGAFIADLFPPNDDRTAARTITGSSGRVVNTNINGHLESGEPDHFTGTPEQGTRSVWFTWTSPTEGEVTFDTIDSNFDTDIAVYTTGNNWNGLALPPVASDNNSGGNGTSRVTFQTNVGVTYYIAINGSGPNDAGFYALNWSIEDNTSPQVTVVSPAHNASLMSFSAITGTAIDGGGIQNNKVTMTLYHEGTGDFWNGSSWVGRIVPIEAPVNGGGAWSYNSVPTGGNLRSGLYYVSVHATDNSGNLSAPVPGVNQTSFRIDNSPPSVGIGAPANGSTITTKTYSFSGTASDSGGLNRVVLFIRRNSDFKYWNGSGWTTEPLSANLSSSYNSGNNTWVLSSPAPVPGSNPSSGLINGSYNFIAIAFDAAGNSQQTDSEVLVDLHETYTWTRGSYFDAVQGNDDYYWGNPANWSPYGVPDTAEIAIIDFDTVRSTISRTVYEFRMSNGGLDFDNAGDSLNIVKKGTWTGGTLSRTTNIQAGAAVTISGPGDKWVGDTSTVNNFGAVTWAGPGLVRGFRNCQWNNKPGSSFTMTADGDVFSNWNAGNVFTNEAGATFTKTLGAASNASTFVDEWTFTNAGKIESQQGALQFSTTLNLNPGANFAGAGRILLNGTINWSATLTSTGNPELAADVFSTSGSFSGSNPFVWSGGTINGVFALANGSVLNLTTAADKWVGDGATFNNFGHVVWSNGWLRGYRNSIFNNESGAVFEAVTDGDIFANYNAGNVFNNKFGGLFLKSGKAATPSSSLVDEWTFNNSGVIRSDDGVMIFNTTLNLNPGGAVARFGSGTSRVISTGVVMLTGTTTINNITFEDSGDWYGNTAPGTAGNGTIATANGLFEWTGGTVFNTVNIATGASFAISGAAMKQVGDAALLNNYGNATWTGTGEIRGFRNSVFANLAGATFSAATDAPFTNYNYGNHFVNALNATFQKTAGAGSVTCYWAFDNAGTLHSLSGAVSMNGGGTSSGKFKTTSPGLVQFSDGQHDLTTTAKFEGTGRTQVLGGTVNAVNHVSADSTGGVLEIVGGTVTSAAAGSFDALGNIEWTGGAIVGTFNVQAGSLFQLKGAGLKEIGDASVLNNSGAATWNGPGLLRGFRNSTWNNKSGGSFTIFGDGDVLANYNAGNVFNNESGATFSKSTGAGGSANSFIDEWSFNNAGKIESQQGTLYFATTQNLNAGSTLAGAGRVLFDGTTNLSALLNSTGHPELVSTLNGTNAAAGFAGTNPFTWSSGTINGLFALSAGSVLDLTTTADKWVGDGATFTNQGRVNWKGGLVRGFRNSVFNNENGATFDATTDGDIFSNYNGGNVFNNKAGALFVKSGQSATPNESFMDEWTFNNNGIIRSDDGLLRFHTALNLNAGGSITRAGALPARVLSTYAFVLTGTTTVSNITFEAAGNWAGDTAAGTAGDGAIATTGGGVFEWTAGTVDNVVSIAPGSTFAISGDNTKQIGSGGVLNNYGSATWTGAGAIQGFQNSTLQNRSGATFLAATDADFTNYSGGNKFQNDGVFLIGTMLGVTDMAWDYVQGASGFLDLELGGTNPAIPQFDQLHIGGTASLAGTIVVNLMSGYIPTPGSAYPVLTFGSHTGSFGTVHSLGSILDFQYNGNNLTLVEQQFPENNLEWKQYYFGDPNSPDAQPNADPNHNGLSNELEYALGRNPRLPGGSPIKPGAASTNSKDAATDAVTVGGVRYMSFSYTRPGGDAALTDVIYIPERAAALTSSTWSSDIAIYSAVLDPATSLETVTVRSTHPMTESNREFMRLKVTLTP